MRDTSSFGWLLALCKSACRLRKNHCECCNRSKVAAAGCYRWDNSLFTSKKQWQSIVRLLVSTVAVSTILHTLCWHTCLGSTMLHFVAPSMTWGSSRSPNPKKALVRGLVQKHHCAVFPPYTITSDTDSSQSSMRKGLRLASSSYNSHPRHLAWYFGKRMWFWVWVNFKTSDKHTVQMEPPAQFDVLGSKPHNHCLIAQAHDCDKTRGMLR